MEKLREWTNTKNIEIPIFEMVYVGLWVHGVGGEKHFEIYWGSFNEHEEFFNSTGEEEFPWAYNDCEYWMDAPLPPPPDSVGER